MWTDVVMAANNDVLTGASYAGADNAQLKIKTQEVDSDWIP